MGEGNQTQKEKPKQREESEEKRKNERRKEPPEAVLERRRRSKRIGLKMQSEKQRGQTLSPEDHHGSSPLFADAVVAGPARSCCPNEEKEERFLYFHVSCCRDHMLGPKTVQSSAIYFADQHADLSHNQQPLRLTY